jgi:hypothetical protein
VLIRYGDVCLQKKKSFNTAVEAVWKGMALHTASKNFNVPHSMLHKIGQCDDIYKFTPNYVVKQVFSEVEEKELVIHLQLEIKVVVLSTQQYYCGFIYLQIHYMFLLNSDLQVYIFYMSETTAYLLLRFTCNIAYTISQFTPSHRPGPPQPLQCFIYSNSTYFIPDLILNYRNTRILVKNQKCKLSRRPHTPP